MNEVIQYEVNDNKYDVIITYKRIKNIIYKFKDNKFLISSPYGVSKKRIIEGLNKYAKSLIKRNISEDKFFKKDGIYILGEFIYFNDGFINVMGHQILFINKEDFYKRIKKIVFPYFYSLLEKYRKIMGISRVYKLKIGFYKTRFGSNSIRSNTISMNMILIHYSEEIITSLVIHELAHDKERNHQANFYKEIYKYMPNYREVDYKLKRGIIK